MHAFKTSFVFFLAGWALVSTERKSRLQPLCKLPVDPGKPCSSGVPAKRYYFSTEKERCTSFNFLGCTGEGNANNFETSNQCIDDCQVTWFTEKQKNAPAPKDGSEVTNRQKSDCRLKSELVGVCKGLIPLWSYEASERKCISFLWGGCNEGSNNNRFESKKQCEEFCKDI